MRKVLIVDDEAMARRMLARTLVKEGYSVMEARDGQQAWEMLAEEIPDAVISDIDMPRMNGEELCKLISTDIADRTFPIFVVTSKTAIEHREWSRKISNLYFLEKPLSLRKLVAKLTSVLEPSNPSAEVG